MNRSSGSTTAFTSIKDRRIRFALVGCGRISANHRKAILQHSEQAELAAICDIDPATLAAVAADCQVPAYPDLPSLLAGSDCDEVVLATPSGLHAQQTIACAAAGRHVMTE